jgi:DNA-binding IclR family transcriptional regulator
LSDPDKPADGVRAVDRALEILLAFDGGPAEMTATELSRRTGLSRPTLYRLMRTLERHGFVDAVGEPQRFRLGATIGRLGSRWTSSLDLAPLAQPALRALHELTGETVALFALRGDRRMCLVEIPSAQPLGFQRGVGYSEAIATGASGRAILAHLPGPPPRSCDGEQPRALAAELARVRERGWAVSRGELIAGAVAIAAPFFGADGRVAGSLAVFGPEARLDEARVARCGAWLVERCAALSAALGHRPA